MFNIFKNNTVDESLEDQIADVEKYPKEISEKILKGESCDVVTDGTGLFGLSPSNPIPVNGVRGEIKYLARLKVKNGPGLIFHRLGSLKMENKENPVDAYEVVSIDMDKYDVIFLDMYHPRRSTKTPDGFELGEYNEMFSKYSLAMGVNDFDKNFPFGIPDLIKEKYGSIGASIAKKLSDEINNKKYNPPEVHKLKVTETLSKLNKKNKPYLKEGEVKSKKYTDDKVDDFFDKNIYPFLTRKEAVDFYVVGTRVYNTNDFKIIEKNFMADYERFSNGLDILDQKVLELLKLIINRQLEDKQKESGLPKHETAKNNLPVHMEKDKILDLVFSSKRTMPAHFYSQGDRKQTFGINFDPLDADTDYEMANTAHNISGMFYSAIPDLNKEEHAALLKYGEDIMLGAYIVCSIDKKDTSKDLQEEIIKENTNLFENRIPERIPDLLKNSNISHALDYYRYVGEQFAEGNRNFFEPPKFND